MGEFRGGMGRGGGRRRAIRIRPRLHFEFLKTILMGSFLRKLHTAGGMSQSLGALHNNSKSPAFQFELAQGERGGGVGGGKGTKEGGKWREEGVGVIARVSER